MSAPLAPVTIPLRWILWGASALVSALAVIGFGWWAIDAYRDDSVTWTLFPVALALVASGALLGLGVLGLCAERRGYALRLDAAGVHHCAMRVLPWGHVTGVEVTMQRDANHGAWMLVLAVDERALRHPGVLLKVGGLLWGLPETGGDPRAIRVPLGFLQCRREELQAVATRYWNRHRHENVLLATSDPPSTA